MRQRSKFSQKGGTKIVQIGTICIILSLVLINNFDITFSQR